MKVILVSSNEGAMHVIGPAVYNALKKICDVDFRFASTDEILKWKREKINKDTIVQCLFDYPIASKVYRVFKPKHFFLMSLGTYSVKPLRNLMWGGYCDVHNGFIRKLKYPRFEFKNVLKKADKIFAISQYTKEQMLKYVNLTNVAVVPLGVDYELFKAEPHIPTERIKLLGVGELKTRKGWDYAIKSLSIVKKEFSNFDYYIIGSRGDKSKLEILRDKLGLKENVHLIGKLDHKTELPKHYHNADIYLMTSINEPDGEFEGFGMVYTEAQCSGTPCIYSSESGSFDAVGEGGLMTKARNPEDIAEKILMLLKNENLRRELGKKAIENAKKLSWDNLAKSYMKHYEEALK